jgi:hypothetical protein
MVAAKKFLLRGDTRASNFNDIAHSQLWHAPIGHLVYHLGPTAMAQTTLGHFTLTEVATKSWHTFTRAGQYGRRQANYQN